MEQIFVTPRGVVLTTQCLLPPSQLPVPPSLGKGVLTEKPSHPVHILGVEGVLPCEPLSTLPNRTTHRGSRPYMLCPLLPGWGHFSSRASFTQSCWASAHQKGKDCVVKLGGRSISVVLVCGLSRAVASWWWAVMWKSQMPRR